jgi:large subunit ribosomal protein L24
MAKVHIRKGDKVRVISGNDAADRKEGIVLKVDQERGRVLVAGINKVVKHEKVTQGLRGSKQGGLVHTEAYIDASNVMVIDPSDGKPTRVGRKRVEVEKTRPDGTTYVGYRNVRISVRTGKEL